MARKILEMGKILCFLLILVCKTTYAGGIGHFESDGRNFCRGLAHAIASASWFVKKPALYIFENHI